MKPLGNRFASLFKVRVDILITELLHCPSNHLNPNHTSQFIKVNTQTIVTKEVRLFLRICNPNLLPSQPPPHLIIS